MVFIEYTPTKEGPGLDLSYLKQLEQALCSNFSDFLLILMNADKDLFC